MGAKRAVLIIGVMFVGCLDPIAEQSPDAGTRDAGSSDASTDGGAIDAGLVDADASIDGGGDAGVSPDAGANDAGANDAGANDAGANDAGTNDAGADDAGANDAGANDAGANDAGTDAGLDGGQDAGLLQGRLWFMRTAVPMLRQVFLQAPVGAQPTLVSAPGREARSMVVSKDGDLIAISYTGSSREIFIGPTDGGPPQLVWSQPGTQLELLALSPDKGHLAVYEESNARGGVLIIPLDGGAAVEASPRVNPVNWYQFKAHFSPNSRFFGLNAGQNWAEFDAGLYMTDTSSGAMAAVRLPWSSNSSPTRFSWFAGDRFVAHASDYNGGSSIVVCSAPDNCAALPEPFDGGTRLVDGERLRVSPDGAFWVVANSTEDAGVHFTNFFRAPLDGGEPTPLASIRDYPILGSALTSDGEQIVVFMITSLTSTHRDLIVHVISTTGPSVATPLCVAPWPVFNDPIGESETLFAPDSSHMIFRMFVQPTGFELWRINLTTPLQTPIVQQLGPIEGERFEWTP